MTVEPWKNTVRATMKVFKVVLESCAHLNENRIKFEFQWRFAWNGEKLVQGSKVKLEDGSEVLILESSPKAQEFCISKSTLFEIKVKRQVDEEIKIESSSAMQSRDLEEISDYIELYQSGVIQKGGVLVFGPEGIGKRSSILQACQKRCIPVIEASRVQSLQDLKDLFRQASGNSDPHVIVIPEMDSVFLKREDFASSHSSAMVALLLTLMDGISSSRHLVFGTAIDPNKIDPALRRPGRFDVEIEVTMNDPQSRFLFVKALLNPKSHSLSELDLHDIATRSVGFFAHDLRKLINLSALRALETEVPLSLEIVLTTLSSIVPNSRSCYSLSIPSITWDDIGGMNQLKKRLTCILSQGPAEFKKFGISPPKGVLLYGPPGCAKSTIAKALANSMSSLGCSFISVDASSLFSSYFGETESQIRQVFSKARLNSPCILFLDELDSIAGKRTSSSSSGSRVQERAVATFLNELDGLGSSSSEENFVFVLAATNFPENIDRALLRPGRIEYHVYVPPPDFETRKSILSLLTKKTKFDMDIDLEEWALKMEGYSGADIESCIREACMLALRRDILSESLSLSDLSQAFSQVKSSITDIRRFEIFASQFKST
jgi:SpoVK/Ycf46/Vps4 family AAA+-type ATPase